MNNQPKSGHSALSGAVWAEAARDEWDALQREATARGVSASDVRLEYLRAEEARYQADADHVQAIISDPAALRALRAQWQPRPVRTPEQPAQQRVQVSG